MDQYASNLNWFDISLISIVFISTIFAMFRGFIKAVFSLIAWVASSSITVFLYPYTHSLISLKVHNEKLAIAAATLGIFLVFFIIFAILNNRILYFLRKVTGGFIDRTLGFCFGVARGVLIVCLIFFSINLTSKMLHLGKNPERPGPEWFSNAGTYEAMEMASSTIVSFAPEDMPDKLEKTINKFKDVTLSAMGDDLEESSGANKKLSDDDRKVMKKIIANLSKEDLAEIYKKYDGNPANLSEFEKIEVFKEIITLYKGYIKDNKIPADKIIPEEKIQALEDSLSEGKNGTTKKSDDEIGYKDNNIKQLDRLVDGVK